MRPSVIRYSAGQLRMYTLLPFAVLLALMMANLPAARLVSGGITDSMDMSLSKLRETVKDREA